jgi:hypothetical protein
MNRSAGLPRLLRTVVYAFLPLVAIPLARGQASASGAEQSQNAAKTVDADLSIFGYEAFLQHLGGDESNPQGAQQDNSTATVRTDYAVAMGIGREEEKSMLAILLDTYRQEKETAAKWGVSPAACRVENISGRFGSKEAENEAACVKENFALEKEARAKLQRELGDQPFKRVDSYINARRWLKQPTRNSQPCDHSADPLQGETPHEACDWFYEELFSQIAARDTENRRVAAGGDGFFDKKVGLYIPVQISAEQRQAVIALSLETDRQLKEADHRFVAAAQEFNRQQLEHFRPNAPTLPIPPEIQSLWKHWAIVKQYISQLKQAVGEDAFGKMDKYLSQSNRAFSGGNASPASGSDPAKGGNPGVQP